jgi:hypothetical protein
MEIPASMSLIVKGSYHTERRALLQKQIVTWSYWLGLLNSLIALGLRTLNAFGILAPTVVRQGKTIWYMSFFKGALLFFLIAIATASYASVRGEKT